MVPFRMVSFKIFRFKFFQNYIIERTIFDIKVSFLNFLNFTWYEWESWKIKLKLRLILLQSLQMHYLCWSCNIDINKLFKYSSPTFEYSSYVQNNIVLLHFIQTILHIIYLLFYHYNFTSWNKIINIKFMMRFTE